MSNVQKSIRSSVKCQKINKVKFQMSKINKVKCQMSKIIKVKCQMSKINKVNFDGAYLRSSSGHFFTGKETYLLNRTRGVMVMSIKV